MMHSISDHETVSGPIFHSHIDGYGAIVSTAAHTHATAGAGAGSPLHSHIEGFTEVEFIPDHAHISTALNAGSPVHSHVGVFTGAVRVPPAHSHAGGLSNHVAQSTPHIHAIGHNGSYVMNVGPAPSGSGSLAFRNTVSPILAKYGVEGSPYKENYLVTKGQALGDLELTYTADGTMMKGSGIRIITDLPIDQGFYPYNVGGPGGGVVLERGSAMFTVDPVNSDPDGISANTLYVTTTASLEAGSEIVFRVRNLNLKVHGTAAGQDPDVDCGGLHPERVFLLSPCRRWYR